MRCERIAPELLPYHFGLIDDGLRSDVEGHLLCCPECLRSFLALKRDIETAESGPRPSPAVLDRLRASAACELGLEWPRRWLWWERPLAFGFASIAILVAMVAVTFLSRVPAGLPHGMLLP